MDESKKSQPDQTTVLISEGGSSDSITAIESLPFGSWEDYRELTYIGEGAGSRVYKATDPTLNRKVALKFLRGDDPGLEKRFVREARAQAQVEHDCVCKIYEVNTFAGKHYIAMQYIEGQTLDKALTELTLEQKCRIMIQICEALHAAHTLGLIHRDIKPANILVEQTESGWRPYVLDFGLAREVAVAEATATGQVLGTPLYMSPEQAWGSSGSLDRRSDIYSLGATFYRILSGRSPLEGNSMEVLVKLLHDDPLPLRKVVSHIPRDLETIVMKCLERDPARRYESARAIAEDLRRYLEGEPIHARPQSFSYLLLRKMKKHRTVIVAAGLLVCVLVVLIAMWMRDRWQAGERALLSQQLGQEVQRMEGNLRHIYMLPLHDIRVEKQKLRVQMENMTSALASQKGKVGEAPVNYALGRMHLALQNYVAARKYLESAWEQGYRTSDVAYALGRAMGALYQRELDQVERSANAEIREVARQRIERQYRTPALTYLKAGQGHGAESTEFIRALITFYEKNYDEAQKHASAAFERIPWLYEAKILEGDIQIARGYNEVFEGSYQEAMEYFRKAAEAYGSAQRIGESDPVPYQGACSAWNSLLYVDSINQSSDLQMYFQKAIDHCSQALKADSEQPDVHAQIARTYYVLSSSQPESAPNAREAINKAMEAARKAVQLDPNHIPSLGILGQIYWEKGKQEMVEGKNPEESFRQSIRHSMRMVQLDPSNISAYNILGLAHLEMGHHEKQFGKDPRNSLKQAAAAYQKAIHLHPRFINAVVNQGLVYYVLGKWEMDHGFDPVASLENAAAALDKGKELSPNLPFNYPFLVSIFRDLGEYRHKQGDDAGKDFASAEKYFQAGVRVNDSYEPLYYEASIFYIIRSTTVMDRGGNSGEDIRKAKELAAKALSLEPAYWNHQIVGRAKSVEARWLILNGKNPSEALIEARRSLLLAHELNPQDSFTQLYLAESYLLQSEWELQKKQNFDSSLQLSKKAIEKTLQLDKSLAEAFCLLAKAHLLESRNATGERRIRAAEAALKALQQALAINRNLERMLAPQLAEARQGLG